MESTDQDEIASSLPGCDPVSVQCQEVAVALARVWHINGRLCGAFPLCDRHLALMLAYRQMARTLDSPLECARHKLTCSNQVDVVPL